MYKLPFHRLCASIVQSALLIQSCLQRNHRNTMLKLTVNKYSWTSLVEIYSIIRAILNGFKYILLHLPIPEEPRNRNTKGCSCVIPSIFFSSDCYKDILAMYYTILMTSVRTELSIWYFQAVPEATVVMAPSCPIMCSFIRCSSGNFRLSSAIFLFLSSSNYERTNQYQFMQKVIVFTIKLDLEAVRYIPTTWAIIDYTYS